MCVQGFEAGHTMNVNDVGEVGNTVLRELGCFDIQIRSSDVLKSRCQSRAWNSFKLDRV